MRLGQGRRLFCVIPLYFVSLALFCCLLLSPSVAAAHVPVALSLLDVNNRPVAHIRLAVWRINIPAPQAFVWTDAGGNASLTLEPGQYYVTGDITALKSLTPYGANRKNDTTTLFFISKPYTVTWRPTAIDLRIDSKSYISLVDIAGKRGFQVHISQKKTGINTLIRLNANHDCLRLYLPTRLPYTIQNADGALQIEWPVYAAPNQQFTFSL